MRGFPAFLDLQGKRAVVVGEREAAFRKGQLLEAAGAEVIYVGELGRADFAGAAVTVVAESNRDKAASLAGAARAAGALVNVVDRPELSDFIMPAIVDREDVVVAISTSGASPMLATKIRATIERLLPARLGALAEFARSFRPAVAGKLAPEARRNFWERFFAGPIAARVLAGDEAGAKEAMIEAINRPRTERLGVVHIVGAGPGDPELLTLKAHRLLQEADVILYDRLVSDEILAFARRDAARLYVGKAKGDHSVPQDEIEERLIALAREGKIVVRLKGGDPFVFGRGGEEFDAVRAAGIDVFVTPGISAALGCAAAANMPLTHRDYSQAITFITGHAKGEVEPDLDWASLAKLGHTLVVYMGVAKAEAIASNLIRHGRSASTPVAIIENGTRPEQRILKGALRDLGRLASAVEGPALLVIGEVAALANGARLDELRVQLRSAA